MLLAPANLRPATLDRIAAALEPLADTPAECGVYQWRDGTAVLMLESAGVLPLDADTLDALAERLRAVASILHEA